MNESDDSRNNKNLEESYNFVFIKGKEIISLQG